MTDEEPDHQGIINGLPGKAELIETLAQEAVRTVDFLVYPDIPQDYGTEALFRPFTLKNPTEFDTPLSHVADALTTLRYSNIGTDVDMVKTDTDDWQGSAALEFREFMSGFPARLGNQEILLVELETILKASRAIVEKSLESVDEVADMTIDVLEQMIADNKAAARAANLAIAGAALTIVAGALTLGAGLASAGAAAILGAASGAVGMGSGAAAALSVEIGGNSPMEVMDSLREAVRKIHEAVDTEEQQVIGWIADDMSEIETHRDSILPRRPALASQQRIDDSFDLPPILR